MTLHPGVEAVATDIVDVSFHIRRELGVGLYESTYEILLAHRLRQRGRKVELKRRIHLVADGVDLGHVGTLDMLVDDVVAVELKATTEHHPIFTAQLLTYLRLLRLPLGFLINFHTIPLRDGIHRHINVAAFER